MNITLNGEPLSLPNVINLQELLMLQAFTPPFAVALNGEFIAASDYPHTALQQNDSLDVLSPIQGG